jgi:hypothetical protein
VVRATLPLSSSSTRRHACRKAEEVVPASARDRPLPVAFNDGNDLRAARINNDDLILCYKKPVGFEHRDTLADRAREGPQTCTTRNAHAFRYSADGEPGLARKVNDLDDKGSVIVAQI